jgi:hypothetical protein
LDSRSHNSDASCTLFEEVFPHYAAFFRIVGHSVRGELGMTVGDDQFCNLQFYRVAQPRGLRGRFEVAAAAGSLTPLVGREGELLDGDFATGAADSSDPRLTIGNPGPGAQSGSQQCAYERYQSKLRWL